MTSAALGAKFHVETLDGSQEVHIKPGFQSDNTVLLKGLGITKLRGNGRGDLIVHVEVNIPTKLNKEQEELLKTFAAGRNETSQSVEIHNINEKHAEGGLFGRFRDAFYR